MKYISFRYLHTLLITFRMAYIQLKIGVEQHLMLPWGSCTSVRGKDLKKWERRYQTYRFKCCSGVPMPSAIHLIQIMLFTSKLFQFKITRKSNSDDTLSGHSQKISASLITKNNLHKYVLHDLMFLFSGFVNWQSKMEWTSLE